LPPARPTSRDPQPPSFEELAGIYGSSALAAAAVCARGALLRTEGELDAAVQAVREGVRLWQAASAPYEAARARLLLAETLREIGTVSPALVELRAASASFESLGARLDAQRATALIDELAAVSRRR
jgi:hypothetical protein